MRKFSLSVFLFFVVLSSCQNNTKKTISQVSDTEHFAEVENLVQHVFDSIWSAKKTSVIPKYHTDDFVLLEHGAVWTNDTIRNWCERAAIRDQGIERTNTFDFFEQKKEGNRIWMAYHNYATFSKDGEDLATGQWLESIVAVRKDSIWQLELMHSTRVPVSK